MAIIRMLLNHDNKENDTQQRGTKLNDTQHTDSKQNDTKNNNSGKNDTQPTDLFNILTMNRMT